MKLGIITSMADSPWGGSEELWVALAQEALEDGHQVSASIYSWDLLPEKIQKIKEQGAVIQTRKRISYSDIGGKIKGKLRQILFAEKELLQFVKREKPDFLFISMGAFCDLEIDPLRKFLLGLKIPFYIVVHINNETSVINNLKLEEIRMVSRNAKKMFFVSKRIREQSERQIALDFKNSEIVVNPVNIDSIGILPYPSSDKIQMACVGRLQVGVKGQSLLIQMLSSKKWKERNWALNIYGEGPDKFILEQLIDHYELKDKVFIKGYVKNIRNEIWKDNHVLVMPSFIEGLPIALLEAMLSGRTAVVTDVGGNSEILSDDVDGFIAEGVTLFSLDKAFERAWVRKEDWQKMGEDAYKKALAYYGGNPVKDLWTRLKKEYA